MSGALLRISELVEGFEISEILMPVLCAVPNMNLGGAPTGKRASTELRDRKIREEADPAFKDKRLEEERASKRRFFACLAGAKAHCLPSLPNIKDRQEDIMYSYLYSGRDVIVRWQQKGKYISCSCDLSSTCTCKGGLRLDRCPTI